IRLQNAEIIGPSGGTTISVYKMPGCETCGEYNEFLNLTVHDGGRQTLNQDHQFYIATSNNLIAGNTIYHAAAAAIHVWNENTAEGLISTGPDNNTIRNNVIRDGMTGSTCCGWGIITGTDHNTLVYNNVVYNVQKTGEGSAGIFVYQSTNVSLYN